MKAKRYDVKMQEFVDSAVSFLKMTLPPDKYNSSIEMRLRYHFSNASPINLQQQFGKWIVDNFGAPVLVEPNKVEVNAAELASGYNAPERIITRDNKGRFYKEGV